MNFERARAVFPGAHREWLDEIELRAPACGIDTPREMASFLAQFGHETRGFTQFVENLSYSAKRMMLVWPRRFPDLTSAAPYEHNPQALAERVYGGRLGNDKPGDGWKYRGRGPQVTGKRNYARASDLIGYDFVRDPDHMIVPEAGVTVACKGWKALGLDWHDDDADARAETLIINGGEVGLRERQALQNKLLEALTEVS